MSGKLVCIKSDGTKEETGWVQSKQPLATGPGYDLIRKMVGGFVERLKVRYEGKLCDAYVNEEGIPRGLEVNTHASKILQDTYPENKTQNLHGPLVIWIPTPKVKSE